MSLADLLRWLHSARKTGTLVVEVQDYTTTIYLKDGHIISTSSTDPRSYLGQFLLAYTRITEEELRRAFETQEKTKVYLGKNIYVKTLLGKVLLEEGLLGEEEIRRVLRIKTEETVYGLFLCDEGYFHLQVDELPPEELIPVSVDPLEVLQQGARRTAEWREIRNSIPSNDAIFRVHPERIPPTRRLDQFQSRLLIQLGEGRSIREIILALHATEFAALSTVHAFIREGLVEIDHEEPATPPPLDDSGPVTDAPDDLVERGRQLFDRRCYADTVVAARQALRGDPTHQEARELLQRSERELTDRFYRRVCGPSDVPHLERPAAEIPLGKLSPEERFLLERVNGTWSVADIVRLSPMKEVDALAVFQKLVDEGLIGIRRHG